MAAGRNPTGSSAKPDARPADKLTPLADTWQAAEFKPAKPVAQASGASEPASLSNGAVTSEATGEAAKSDSGESDATGVSIPEPHAAEGKSLGKEQLVTIPSPGAVSAILQLAEAQTKSTDEGSAEGSVPLAAES